MSIFSNKTNATNTIKTAVASTLIACSLFALNIEQAASVELKRATPVQVGPSQQPSLNFSVPFSTTCATGFSKAGQKEFGNGDLDWYVCSTPVISCPSYKQENGLWANVTPKAIVQMIGGSPDAGGAKKFRIQYKCDYSPAYVPVP